MLTRGVIGEWKYGEMWIPFCFLVPISDNHCLYCCVAFYRHSVKHKMAKDRQTHADSRPRTLNLVTLTVLEAGLIGLSFTSAMVRVMVAVAERLWASPSTSGSSRVTDASLSSGTSDVTTARPRPSSPSAEKCEIQIHGREMSSGELDR